jgi:hypothetical protein
MYYVSIIKVTTPGRYGHLPDRGLDGLATQVVGLGGDLYVILHAGPAHEKKT